MPLPTEIRSLDDLVAIVMDWENRLVGPLGGLPFFWYRGHQDFNFELQPTVLRKWFGDWLSTQKYHFSTNPQEDLESHEITFNREFRRMAASFHLGSDSDVETYFLQQHHGMPTRLLDWSRNAMIALFFAVTPPDDIDGCVLVMDPRRIIPRTPGLPNDVVHARHAVVEETIRYLYEGSPLVGTGLTPPSPPWVIPVSPDLRAGRVLQQDSCFTLHMPRSTSLAISKGVIEQYRVPYDKKPELRFALRAMGMGYAHVYADLDNVSRDIRTAWGLYP